MCSKVSNYDIFKYIVLASRQVALIWVYQELVFGNLWRQ